MDDKKPKYERVEVKETEILYRTGISGEKEGYLNVEGLNYPVFWLTMGQMPDPRINIPKVRNMPCRDTDIVLCAYMKSGTHWVWEICSMLATGKLEYQTQPKEANMLDFHYPEEYDTLTSPRIFNTHYPFRLLPDEVKEGSKGKIILILRNPKDVAVSSYHQFMHLSRTEETMEFKSFLSAFVNDGLTTNWFDYTKDWASVISSRKDLAIHVLYFENLKKNPEQEITALSEFLGTSTDADFISKVAEMCLFKNMKKMNDEVKDLSAYKREEKLMKNMYRKGDIGDWKNMFTVALNEYFDEKYAEQMKGCNFTFTFS